MRSSEFNVVGTVLNASSVSFIISCLVVGKLLSLSFPFFIIRMSSK